MAKQKGRVGQSDVRTRCKHDILDRLLGAQVGMIFRGNTPLFIENRESNRPSYFGDLNAGDGVPSTHSGNSSPQIFSKHLGFLKKNKINFKSFSIEKDFETHNRLESFAYPNIQTYCADSTVEPSFPVDFQPNSFVFLYNDPNKVSDWAIKPWLLERLVERRCNFITLNTLGCNVSGHKRVCLEERELWVRPIRHLAAALPWNVHRKIDQDAWLLRLNKDKSQWSYLVTAPRIWGDRIERLLKSSFKHWPEGVIVTSFRDQQDQFNAELALLFLTNAERDDDVKLGDN